MIGASKYKKNKEIPLIDFVDCPACGKQRLNRYVQEDGTIEEAATDTVDVRGETRYLDVCQFCVEKYQNRDKRYVIDNMKKLRKAFQETQDGTSDHNDFSLNLD